MNREALRLRVEQHAGPWDFIGHAELPETKTDGKIARHLDRDDMVANTMAVVVPSLRSLNTAG